MQRFQGKTVLVTGASRGLGAHLARAFGREGARVLVNCRTQTARAADVAAAIRAEGGQADVCAFDVCDAQAVKEAFAGLHAGDGRLDVLVNNAGILLDAHFVMMKTEDWRSIIDTNLTGACLCAQAAARVMGRSGGVILNVSSISALVATPHQAAYAASKGGLLSLTRTLAHELAPQGIRVNALVPGLINTGMTERMDRRVTEDLIARIPLKRLGTPDEAVGAALFLASDAASYITGQALAVDGGLSG